MATTRTTTVTIGDKAEPEVGIEWVLRNLECVFVGASAVGFGEMLNVQHQPTSGRQLIRNVPTTSRTSPTPSAASAPGSASTVRVLAVGS